jgi:hypothetical protein
MHDWDKGPTNGDMMRQAMRAVGVKTSQQIFDEEIAKLRVEEEAFERQRLADERQRKVDRLAQLRGHVAALEYELGYRAAPDAPMAVVTRPACICNGLGPTNCPACT